MSFRSVAISVGIAIVSCAAGAAAQGSPAEAIFLQGKDAMDAGRHDEACALFEKSYTMEGRAGALLSWADCEEHRGRYATALRLWQEGSGKVTGDAERAKFVAGRIDKVRPKVSRLIVRVEDPAATGATITVDGKAATSGGEGMPLDPGKHVVVATAPNRASEEATVDLSIGETETLSVLATSSTTTTPPPVVPDPTLPNPEPPDPTPRADSGPNGLVIGGWVTGAIGAAGLLAFAGTGAAVLATCDESGMNAEGEDVEGSGCPEGSQGLLIGNAVSLGVGAAGVAVGAILLGVGYARNASDSESSGASAAAPILAPGPGDVGFNMLWTF